MVSIFAIADAFGLILIGALIGCVVLVLSAKPKGK